MVRDRGVGAPRDAVVGGQVTRPLRFVEHQRQPQNLVVVVAPDRDGHEQRAQRHAPHHLEQKTVRAATVQWRTSFLDCIKSLPDHQHKFTKT